MLINITLDDEIETYRVRFLGNENINIIGEKVATRKIEIMLSNEDEAKDEGWLKLWLTDDEYRTLLSCDIV